MFLEGNLIFTFSYTPHCLTLCVPQIEAPYMEPSNLSAEDESVNVGKSEQASRLPLQYHTEQLPDFNSIGEFYTTLERSM